MKTISTIIISALLLFTYGCSTEKNKGEHSEHDGDQTTDEVLAAQLDNGNKWVANIETTQGIQKMIQLINTNPTSLKENLLSEFTDVLKKCTMKGRVARATAPLSSSAES
ncbi:MAG: hypothetical protein IPK96_17410 [Flammeovirgaceae bacterium]|nr:hypothetical protein [Flammeovirgaceae bacterium]